MNRVISLLGLGNRDDQILTELATLKTQMIALQNELVSLRNQTTSLEIRLDQSQKILRDMQITLINTEVAANR